MRKKIKRNDPALIYGTPRFNDGRGLAIGRPSAVSARVRTPTTNGFVTRVSAIDDVDTDLSTAAEEGDTSILLTDESDLRRFGVYMITLQNGERFEVESAVTEDAATTATIRQPLLRDVASGDLFQGVDVSVQLLAADVTDLGECVIEWTATINGQEYEWAQAFWITERVFHPTLTPSELTARYPIIRQLQDADDVDLTEAIEAAWSEIVHPRLEAKGMREELIVTPEKLEPWIASAAVFHLLQQDSSRPLDYIRHWQDTCDEAEDLALQSKSFWYDYSEDLLGQSQANADDNSNSPWTILRVTR